jgi:hypothetical protein
MYACIHVCIYLYTCTFTYTCRYFIKGFCILYANTKISWKKSCIHIDKARICPHMSMHAYARKKNAQGRHDWGVDLHNTSGSWRPSRNGPSPGYGTPSRNDGTRRTSPWVSIYASCFHERGVIWEFWVLFWVLSGICGFWVVWFVFLCAKVINWRIPHHTTTIPEWDLPAWDPLQEWWDEADPLQVWTICPSQPCQVLLALDVSLVKFCAHRTYS